MRATVQSAAKRIVLPTLRIGTSKGSDTSCFNNFSFLSFTFCLDKRSRRHFFPEQMLEDLQFRDRQALEQLCVFQGRSPCEK
ncbi:hypothetical protein RIR_jg20089.t1 [Rhizophagus irregularis DAOM 181602=DAOM 197198]|nr:hypothetical protein RIR_jg20089.t1 [Rhizophagus irregularis DAOM 181602=DAOM 197198]